MRRSRHCRVSADNSISAMLSPDLRRTKPGEFSGFGRFERLVERSGGVGVQVVHHEHDPVGVGIVDGEQALNLVGPVDPGTPGPGDDAAGACERLDPYEDRAGAVPDVLGIFFEVVAGAGGDRVAGMGEELVGLLVHAHHRRGRVQRAGVHVQDVLHARGELAAAVRRDGPALLQMRTTCPLLRTLPIVEWSRSGMSSIRATCFSSSRSDQRA